MNQALLAAGGQIERFFKAELVRHVARHAILGRSSVVAIKADGVLC
jgi:hypothetical protein